MLLDRQHDLEKRIMDLAHRLYALRKQLTNSMEPRDRPETQPATLNLTEMQSHMHQSLQECDSDLAAIEQACGLRGQQITLRHETKVALDDYYQKHQAEKMDVPTPKGLWP